jgi:hypothetical protein
MPQTFSAPELVVAISIAAIVGLAIGFLIARRSAAKTTGSRNNTNIFLSEQADGCGPSNPLTLHVRHGERVIWHVTNNCGAAYYVRLDKFKRRKPDGSLGSPEIILEPPAPETANAIPPRGSGVINAKVLTSAGEDVAEYKYEIQLKDTAPGSSYRTRLDPDIDIWP